MNSVMDDNRLLTLPSNERIPLKAISGKERTTRYKDLYTMSTVYVFLKLQQRGLINGIFSRFAVFGTGGGFLMTSIPGIVFFNQQVGKH